MEDEELVKKTIKSTIYKTLLDSPDYILAVKTGRLLMDGEKFAIIMDEIFSEIGKVWIDTYMELNKLDGKT